MLVDVHWSQLTDLSGTVLGSCPTTKSKTKAFLKCLGPTRVNNKWTSWVSLLVSVFLSVSYHLGCLLSYHSCVLNIHNALVLKCVE